MANSRVFSFFQDASNRSIALSTNNNVNVLRDLLNKKCDLGLTESLRNCTSPNRLSGIIKIWNCVFSTPSSVYITGTCDDLSLFNKNTIDCITTTQNKAKENIPSQCKAVLLTYGIVIAIGLITLAALGYYKWRQHQQAKESTPLTDHHLENGNYQSYTNSL